MILTTLTRQTDLRDKTHWVTDNIKQNIVNNKKGKQEMTTKRLG